MFKIHFYKRLMIVTGFNNNNNNWDIKKVCKKNCFDRVIYAYVLIVKAILFFNDNSYFEIQKLFLIKKQKFM